MEVIHHYNNDHNTHSAEIIVPYIIELLNPKSVVDVGCGLGQWLYVFKKNGVKKILGIDGDHVPKEKIYVIENFFEFDLNNCENYINDEKFDLAMSLEVAEHLAEDKAEVFINMLIRLSDTIIFSAALPGQTGEKHFNEQYPEYWIRLFKKHGYNIYDPFRKRFWSSDVNWWYSQNMFLFVKNNIPLCDGIRELNYDGNIYISPKLFEWYKDMVKLYINENSNKNKASFLKRIINRITINKS